MTNPTGLSSGGVASTLQVATAGVGSVLPTGSVARTASVWVPSARPVSPSGDEQLANAPPSKLQVKVDPASVAVNAIEIARRVVSAGTLLVMLVADGVRSTVKLRDATAERFPAVSRAAT